MIHPLHRTANVSFLYSNFLPISSEQAFHGQESIPRVKPKPAAFFAVISGQSERADLDCSRFLGRHMQPTVDITYRCVPEGPLPRAKCCILTLLNTQADCSVPLQLEIWVRTQE